MRIPELKGAEIVEGGSKRSVNEEVSYRTKPRQTTNGNLEQFTIDHGNPSFLRDFTDLSLAVRDE